MTDLNEIMRTEAIIKRIRAHAYALTSVDNLRLLGAQQALGWVLSAREDLTTWIRASIKRISDAHAKRGDCHCEICILARKEEGPHGHQ